VNTTVIVRDYRDSDYAFVNQMLLDSFSVTKGEDNLIGAEYHELVGVIDSNVVGYLLLTKVYNPIIQKSYHLIDYVCVSSNYRRLGVGKALLQKAYEIARSEHAIYLQLTCSNFRIAAHKLYENCGYVKRESDLFRKEIV
jgi:ribosomal protein S18 acetylase RimI-like enzyme